MTESVAQNEHDFATKDMCREKPKWNIWAFGVIFALMSLFLALSGVALANSSFASSRLGEVQVKLTSQIGESDKTLGVHLARQEESNKALLTTLASMKKSIEANTETLQAQSQQLALQNQLLTKLVEIRQ